MMRRKSSGLTAYRCWRGCGWKCLLSTVPKLHDFSTAAYRACHRGCEQLREKWL